jgi:hypothetical protein
MEGLERMTRKRSRKEMAAQIENVIGRRKTSIKISILLLAHLVSQGITAAHPNFVELILREASSSSQSFLE